MRVWRGTRHVCFVSSYLFYFGRVVGGKGGGGWILWIVDCDTAEVWDNG